MCHFDGRSDTEAEAIITIVEGAVEAQMRAQEPFTALDISNALKGQNYPVRHREVSAVVRDIYDSGAMGHYRYERKLIDVQTDGGRKRVEAWLYLHDDHKDRDYATTLRAQDALPPVPDAQARSLDDVAPAGNPLSPLVARGQVNAYVAQRNRAAVQMARGLKVSPWQSTTASSYARPRRRTRGAGRRDGALAIPRRLVEQAGWQVGDQLTLAFDAASARLVLTTDAASAAVTATVRVWADLRVRVAKTKVRRCAAPLAANYAVAANKPSFAVDADGTLQIEP